MARTFAPRTPCVDCSTPCTGTRCRRCWLRTQRRPAAGPKVAREGYDWSERKRRKATVDAWVAEHGWMCPGYGIAAHMVMPGKLSADHVTPVARGGPENGPLAVLCLSCNSAKRDGRKPRAATAQRRAAAVRPAERTAPGRSAPAEPSRKPKPAQPVQEPAMVAIPMPPKPPPAPVPDGLKASGTRLWQAVVEEFDLQAHELAQL